MRRVSILPPLVALAVAAGCARAVGASGGDGAIGDVSLLDGATARDAGTSGGFDATADGPAVRAWALGSDFTCAIRADRSVWCWGSNRYGQLGELGPPLGIAGRARPRPVPGVRDAVQIATHGGHVCAVVASGRVLCWGRGDWAQRGDGLRDTVGLAPVEVPRLTDAEQVCSGGDFGCARSRAGGVHCWGNANGRVFGFDPNAGLVARVPVPVPGVTDAIDLSCDRSTVCVVRRGRAVTCWGGLGLGTESNGMLPREVAALRGAIALSQHAPACAILPGGAVRCWGLNEEGQLGIGSAGPARPIDEAGDVPGVREATSVAHGGRAVCASNARGEVRCWGDNRLGQLGDGTLVSRPRAPDAPTHARVATLGLSDSHGCAATLTGDVHCWGLSTSGQLGDAPGATPRPPPDAMPLPEWLAVTRPVPVRFE